MRSEPERCSGPVRIASPPNSLTASTIRWSSVATRMRPTRSAERRFRQTCSMRDRPPAVRNGLPGSRVLAYRAGITAATLRDALCFASVTENSRLGGASQGSSWRETQANLEPSPRASAARNGEGTALSMEETSQHDLYRSRTPVCACSARERELYHFTTRPLRPLKFFRRSCPSMSPSPRGLTYTTLSLFSPFSTYRRPR